MRGGLALVAVFALLYGYLGFRLLSAMLTSANAGVIPPLVTAWPATARSVVQAASSTARGDLPAAASPSLAASATIRAEATLGQTQTSVPTQPRTDTPAPSGTASAQPTALPTGTPVVHLTATTGPTPLPTGTAPALATAASSVTTAPTLVRTAPPTSQPTQGPPGGTPGPTSSPAATAEASPVANGDGTFSGLRLNPEQLDKGVAALFGDFVNNSGRPEAPTAIRGTFYDADGRVLDTQDSTAFWPIAVVPPGSHVPFMMFAALDPQAVATYGLEVEADPTDQAPSQDFQFSGVQTTPGTDDYCLAGQVSHPGAKLVQDAEIVAVLYDSQSRVINFGNASPELAALTGGQPVDFNICVPSYSQAVDHYDLGAWGW